MARWIEDSPMRHRRRQPKLALPPEKGAVGKSFDKIVHRDPTKSGAQAAARIIYHKIRIERAIFLSIRRGRHTQESTIVPKVHLRPVIWWRCSAGKPMAVDFSAGADGGRKPFPHLIAPQGMP
jgi:hypothetical protein